MSVTRLLLTLLSNLLEARLAAVPLDVRWWLRPTGGHLNHFGAMPLLGRSPRFHQVQRKGKALPHIGRQSRKARKAHLINRCIALNCSCFASRINSNNAISID